MGRFACDPLRLKGPLRLGLSPVFILFGTLIGLLLGISSKFEYESDVEESFHETARANEALAFNHREQEVWIRCVIMVQAFTPKAEKFVSASKETFAKKCNETIYFTSSTDILKKFSESGNVFLIETTREPNDYSYFYRVLLFLKQKRRSEQAVHSPAWTVFLNEQTYLLADNLRKFLSSRNSNATQMIGRLSEVRSLFTYLFPFSQTTTFSTDAGVVLSPAALELILSSRHCSASSWLAPRSTGKALFRCAQLTGAPVVDPVDKDGYHLFNTLSPRTLFSKWATTVTKTTFEAQRTLAACCSDTAISFGLVNYRDQRVMDYALERMRVFGI